MIKNTLKNGKSLVLAAVVVGTLALGGCAHGPSNRQLGIGAGAVAGGAVGNVLFGGPVGTIGGAAAGALIGNELTSGRHR
jgi:osmotically inducible lipoprotein OsmB